jgi:hypothetical protein
MIFDRANLQPSDFSWDVEEEEEEEVHLKEEYLDCVFQST